MVSAAVAAASIAGSVAGSALQANAAGDASDKQIAAAKNGQQLLQQYYGIGAGALAPYVGAGSLALGQLQSLTGTGPGGNPLTAALTKPFNPTMADLEGTPGYQFTQAQGLKAVQNSMAAKGLGGSGEALAGAANYSNNLAATTYQQQFQNYLTQNQQIFSMLSGQAGQGLGASGTLAQLGLAAGGGQASLGVGAGNAAAAGANATGTGLNSIFNSLGNSPINYLGIQNYLKGLPASNPAAGTSTVTNSPNLTTPYGNPYVDY